jgi:hypothetical protein
VATEHKRELTTKGKVLDLVSERKSRVTLSDPKRDWSEGMVQASGDSQAHELLKREIISLGGDLDDFELLKKVEDGEEEEWRPKREKDGQVRQTHSPVDFP